MLCQHTSVQGPVFFGKNSINLYVLGPQLPIADCVHQLLVKVNSAVIGAVGGTAATASVLMYLICVARPSLFHSMPYAPTMPHLMLPSLPMKSDVLAKMSFS